MIDELVLANPDRSAAMMVLRCGENRDGATGHRLGHPLMLPVAELY
jgi:hypothetical protein